MPRRTLIVMPDSPRCHVLIGSSSEGKGVARALQAELLADCEVVLWNQGVYEPSSFTLESLITEAHRSDFAVLVATPDDMRGSRGQTTAVPRDNVILEFGLFAGVLGRDRTYVLATDGALLPTDALGLTRLTYHQHENLRAALAVAAEEVRGRIGRLGQRDAQAASSHDAAEGSALAEELAKLAENAAAQGWVVKDTKTTLRLTSPRGKKPSRCQSRLTMRRGTPCVPSSRDSVPEGCASTVPCGVPHRSRPLPDWSRPPFCPLRFAPATALRLPSLWRAPQAE